jgi:hypothetical protein
MTGTVTTGNISRLLQDGINSVFDDRYKQYPPEFPMIFDKENSQKNFEVDVQVEGFGLADVKPEGDDITFDSFRQGFTPKYPMITVAKGYVVTKEALADDRYGEIRKKAESLADSMRTTKEIFGANVLNRGFNSAYTMIDGDGIELFATNHPLGPTNSGTFSNELATPADLSEAALEDMLIQISEAVDARGKRVALQGSRLIVAPNNQFEAQRILGSVLQNDTGNNATNAIRDMNALRDGYTVNHYLTSPSAWFIKTDCNDGLKHFERQAMERGEDNAFSSGNLRYKADERYQFGWTNARGMYGSSGSV